MRLLQINSTANSGSTGKIAEYIAETFAEQGWETYMAYGRKAAGSKSELIRIGNKWDSYYHKLFTLVTDKHGLASKQATIGLLQNIDRIAPNIVFLHNLHGYYIHIQLLFDYLKEKKIPVIWTLFDCWAFTGHCSYFDDIACEKWKVHCQQCPKTHKYPQSLGVDNSKSNFSLKKALFSQVPRLELVVHSNWLGQLVSESFLGKYPIHTIHSGIDLSVFSPQGASWNGKTGDYLVLGVASIWDKRKGLNDFVQLSYRLPKGFQLVLVGVTQAQQGKLPKSIQVLSRTENQAELAALYRTANVFVNPTTQDNFPTTNLEALASGTPVVTYATGGSPEAIDEDTGVLVEKGDIDALQQAIVKICTQWDAEQVRTTCRDRAIRHFNASKQYRQYFSLASKLIKGEANQ